MTVNETLKWIKDGQVILKKPFKNLPISHTAIAKIQQGHLIDNEKICYYCGAKIG